MNDTLYRDIALGRLTAHPRRDFHFAGFNGPAGMADHVAPFVRADMPGGWLCVETIGADDAAPDPDDFAVVLAAADAAADGGGPGRVPVA